MKEKKKTRIAWNKGLTKETDERVRLNGEKTQATRLFRADICKEGAKKAWITRRNRNKTTAWNKGLSKETDIRVKMSGETRSRYLKEKFDSGKLVVWNKGKTKETDERVKRCGNNISLAAKGNKKYKWSAKKRNNFILKMTGHDTPDIVIQKMKNAWTVEKRLKSRMKRLTQIFPFKDTKIEIKMQDELSSRGYGYYKHYPVMGQPDIAFPDQKVAVFCDGCYWHSCLEHYNRSNCEQKEKDNIVNKTLNNSGWLVLRYWEHEINANVEAVVDEIEDVVFKRMIS